MVKKNIHNHSNRWYRLDNAAKIFPSIVTDRLTTVFRLSVTLTVNIDPECLQKALHRLMPRFPYYRVCLKRGLFWHYLEQVDNLPIVQIEDTYPCRRPGEKGDAGFLFRVLYFKDKIITEFSHILTDGTGALIFLKALTASYLTQTGQCPLIDESLFPPGQMPRPGEFEDSYKKYYKKGIPLPADQINAFHCPGSLINRNEYIVTTGIIPQQQVKSLAAGYNVTITECIAGMYIYTLYQFILSLPPGKRIKYLKPIRLMIPVNLRKLYPSRSMRNFFLAVTPGIDPRLGDYTVEDIIKEVHHYMQVEVNDRFINQQITRNVKTEQHPLVRIIPLCIKIWIEKMVYNRIATAVHSGVMTNLGKVDMPQGMAGFIKRFEFIPNPNPLTKVNFALITFNGSVVINFARLIRESHIEREFFSLLRRKGLSVKIETNIELEN